MKADPRQMIAADTPMIDLVCQVLHRQSTQQVVEHLLEPLGDTEWGLFIHTAWQQGIANLIYRRFIDLGAIEKVPERTRKLLHEGAVKAGTSTMLMLYHAGEILKNMKAKGLPVITLKGLYLAENVYSDISLRTFGDLDLMVHKGHVNEAIACLQDLGYTLVTYYNSGDVNRDIKHVPPMIKTSGPCVEIHWTILEEDEPFTIDAGGLWQRAVPARVAGVDVLALGCEDLVLHLCVHLGYQHNFKIGLMGLYDIVEVLQHFQASIDWRKLIATAREWGAERVVWLVLKLAKELLGAEAPGDVYGWLIQETVPEALLAEARVQLLVRDSQVVQMTPDLAKLASSRGLLARSKVLLSRVLIPRAALARLYNVPPRSLRIIGCYFRRARDLWQSYRGAIKQVLSQDKAAMAGVAGEKSTEHLRTWMAKTGC